MQFIVSKTDLDLTAYNVVSNAKYLYNQRKTNINPMLVGWLSLIVLIFMLSSTIGTFIILMNNDYKSTFKWLLGIANIILLGGISTIYSFEMIKIGNINKDIYVFYEKLLDLNMNVSMFYSANVLSQNITDEVNSTNNTVKWINIIVFILYISMMLFLLLNYILANNDIKEYTIAIASIGNFFIFIVSTLLYLKLKNNINVYHSAQKFTDLYFYQLSLAFKITEDYKVFARSLIGSDGFSDVELVIGEKPTIPTSPQSSRLMKNII